MFEPKLKGIYTPHIIPLTKTGEINEAELRKYIDWLIEKGVSGLYPNGSTGEFTRFSPEERREIIRIVSTQAAGRVPIMAGATEANLRDTLDACSAYAEMGCLVAAVVPPYYYKLSQESVVEYFSELARQTDIDLMLYNIPQFTNEISIDSVTRLADFSRIVGIKDSSRDFPRFLNLMNNIRPKRPDFSFLIGTEEILMPALVMGADGGTIATSGVVPEVVMKLYNLTLAGELDEARRIQYKLLELINVMLNGAGFPEGFKAAVDLRGFVTGPSRQPLSPKEKSDLSAVRATLHCILSQHGFVADSPGVEEPIASGCGTPFVEEGKTGTGISEEQVKNIVAEIISRMQNEG